MRMRFSVHTTVVEVGFLLDYIKRQKNDATDAEVICEAVTRAYAVR
jgi:hypothetical protein